MRTIFRRGRPVWLLPLLFFAVFIGGGIIKPMAQPSKAEAKSAILGIPNPATIACDALPDGIAKRLCKAGADPIGTAVGAIPGIGGIPGAIGQFAIDQSFGRIAQIFGGYVVKALSDQATYINNNSGPDFAAKYWVHLFDYFYWWADIIAFGALMLATILDVKQLRLAQWAGDMAKYAIFVAFIASLPEIVNHGYQIAGGDVSSQFLHLANLQGNDLIKNVVAKANHELGVQGDITAIAGLFLTGVFGSFFAWFIKIILGVVEYGLLFFTLTEAISFALFVFGRIGYQIFVTNTMILLTLIVFKPIMGLLLLMTVSMANSPQAGLDTLTMVVVGMFCTVSIPVGIAAYFIKMKINPYKHATAAAGKAGSAGKKIYMARKAAIAAAAV